MPSRRTYSDDALAEAVASAHSWRGVLRALGLAATSAAALRSVRARADALALDYTHFTGQRRWTDRELADAVGGAGSWREVIDKLRLAGGSSQVTLKAHAARLGLETSHLSVPASADRLDAPHHPDISNLARAGSMLAAAWFTLCGYEVSWPLEPARYDLLVALPDGFARVQVKTTTFRTEHSWRAWLSTTGRTRSVYDPDDIDYFFVIDGDLIQYLIPAAAVGGLHAITLSSYETFRVESYRGPEIQASL
ncbi:MAG: group I intron-associated PD-(D/E)XK endonuclease [Nocardioides sp.]